VLRGGDYCRADSDLLYGHVEQVVARDERKAVLLRCSSCGWPYEDGQRFDPVHVSVGEARERFGYSCDRSPLTGSAASVAA